MSKEQKDELVKIKVLKRCPDNTDRSKYFEADQEIEVSKERADAAVAKGLAEIVEEGI